MTTMVMGLPFAPARRDSEATNASAGTCNAEGCQARSWVQEIMAGHHGRRTPGLGVVGKLG